MSNARKITENLSESYQFTGSETENGAGEALSRALRALNSITAYDEKLAGLEEQLLEIDGLLSDYNREVSEYLSDMEFDEEAFRQVEDRLNEINRLKGKYGKTIEEVLVFGESRKQLLDKLADYDAYMEGLHKEEAQIKEKLLEACVRLSEIRKENAEELTLKLQDALVNLNFLTVEFEIAVRRTQNVTALGFDEVEFLISTNPGRA